MGTNPEETIADIYARINGLKREVQSLTEIIGAYKRDLNQRDEQIRQLMRSRDEMGEAIKKLENAKK